MEDTSISRSYKEDDLAGRWMRKLYVDEKGDGPNTLVIFAIYTSRQPAYAWHLKQDYIKVFFASLEGKLMGKPMVYNLEER